MGYKFTVSGYYHVLTDDEVEFHEGDVRLQML
jgi:hypothetical protein